MSFVSLQQAFTVAFQHYQAGRLGEAESLYRGILAAHPNQPDALHMLGVIAHQVGRSDTAVDLLHKAVQFNPANPAALSNYSMVLRAVGRTSEAILILRRAIELSPSSPEPYNSLGRAFADQGNLTEALTALRKALSLKPDFVEAYNNLGNVLEDFGRFEDAIAAFRRAIELRPEYAEAWNNLGVVLIAQSRIKEAIEAYRRATELRPSFAEAHHNLGVCLLKDGLVEGSLVALRQAIKLEPRYPVAWASLANALMDQGCPKEAYAACQHALELQPDLAEGHLILGNVFMAAGRFEEAVKAYRRALSIKPDYLSAFTNLGTALMEIAEFDEAETAYRKSLELRPYSGEAEFSYALLLLLRGDFKRGWFLNEARLRRPRAVNREFPQPRWEGAGVPGTRLLIHAEQGFGDAIQFVRYAELIAERGVKVIVECPPPLVELFRSHRRVSEVVATGDKLPEFDFHTPMLSLPLVFETTLEAIPRKVPYLFVDARRWEAWSDRIGKNAPHLRVGIAWSGNPKHRRNLVRNVPLKMLLPALSLEGLDLYALQKLQRTERSEPPQISVGLIDHTANIFDFADTAALMMNLDLIISVDTAVAHLAGALGRPVWTLLPFVPDWRWGLEGEATPWYPTMRLFRQPKLGDWESVIQRVQDELERMVKTRSL